MAYAQCVESLKGGFRVRILKRERDTVLTGNGDPTQFNATAAFAEKQT